MNSKIKDSLTIICGAFFYFLAFPTKYYNGFFITAPIGIALFFYIQEKTYFEQKKIAPLVFNYLLFSLFIFLLGFNWIPYTLSEFGDIPAPLNYILGVFFSPFLLPQLFIYTLGLIIIRKLKLTFLKPQHYLYTTLWSTLLVLIELITPQQFPTFIGHTWIVIAPYLGLASYYGVLAYSFAFYLFAFSLIKLLKYKKVDYLPFIFFFTFLGLNIYTAPQKIKSDDKLKIRIVQANIGNFMKVASENGDEEAAEEIFNSYKELSLEGGTQGIDLIVWPETALPVLLSTDAINKKEMPFPKVIDEVSAKVPLLFGGYDFANNDNPYLYETEYNSSFYVEKSIIKEVYHKKVLLNFGETLPFGRFNKIFHRYIPALSFFAKGKKFPLFKMSATNAKFIPNICYELLYPDFIRSYLNSLEETPHFMVNLTNDSWYGDTSEPHQHLALAKWRALESGIPIIRSTNTGITSIIRRDGTESERLNVGEKKALDIEMPLGNQKKTLYTKYGDKSVFLMILCFLIIVYLSQFLRPAFKRS